MGNFSHGLFINSGNTAKFSLLFYKIKNTISLLFLKIYLNLFIYAVNLNTISLLFFKINLNLFIYSGNIDKFSFLFYKIKNTTLFLFLKIYSNSFFYAVN